MTLLQVLVVSSVSLVLSDYTKPAPIRRQDAYGAPSATAYQDSYTAPSYSAPSYSAPSYSAPSYQAPSYSAPTYSAPSYNTVQSVEVRLLNPSGTQEVRTTVCPAQICLEHSIFILEPQILHVDFMKSS